MRLEIQKSFLTASDCSVLNDWVADGIKCGWVGKGFDPRLLNSHSAEVSRLTSRMYGDKIHTPPEVLEISDRVRRFAGVATYPIISGHGKDGIVVNYITHGGDVYRHKDPVGNQGFAALRCNVLIKKPDKGGILSLDGKAVSLDVGDLHCYLASEHFHEVSTVFGAVPRVLCMFGAFVPAGLWNSGDIKFGVNDGIS